jgi:hypothetical protein
VKKLKLHEFWMLLEKLDDQAKRESGEAKKYELLSDSKYEG